MTGESEDQRRKQIEQELDQMEVVEATSLDGSPIPGLEPPRHKVVFESGCTRVPRPFQEWAITNDLGLLFAEIVEVDGETRLVVELQHLSDVDEWGGAS